MTFLKKITKTTYLFVWVLAILAIFIGYRFAFPAKLDSANLTSVKNTLSNSRLSYVGAVGAGNTVGSSIVTIKTTSLPGWATSDDTDNLFSGDTLHIGSNDDYTVVDIYDTNEIQIYHAGDGLQATDVDVDDPIIATSSAQHTLTFTPVTAINNGYYRVRIKATAGTAAQSHDGIPDADGFDFRAIDSGTWPDYISCPDSATPTIEYSGDTHCPSGYTCILCDYSGVNTLAQKTLSVGTTVAAQQPINPAPSAVGKTAGVADAYTFYVDHLDNSYNSIDSTQGKIVVVESVRVTAVVEPILELTVAGIGTGQTACGNALDVTATAVTVPFGSISITDFTDAAQSLTVSINADDGYSVTAIESDQLRMISGTGLGANDIDDTLGDTGDCEYDDKDEWSSTATKGFGYSLEEGGAPPASIAFEYDNADSGCSGTGFCAKQLADNAAVETAQEIFSSTTTADSENVYVCYRIIISGTQEAGIYTNSVTYIASATF